MLEYLYTEGRNDVPVPVRLEQGKVVGEIRPVNGGWQYFPRDSKHGWDVFPSLTECQRSLKQSLSSESDAERGCGPDLSA